MLKIVLLPGLDGTGILFEPLIAVLPKQYELVVISYPLDRKLNYEELVGYVCEKLPQEDYLLIAESFSGYIAYKIAQRKPDNLKEIIFVATFLQNPRPVLSKYFLKLPLKFMLSLPFPKILVKKYLLGKKMDIKLFQLFRKSVKKVNKNVLIHRIKLISTLYPKLEKLNCKSTYIQALDDKLVPPFCAENFQKYFVNSSIIKIKGPHFLLQARAKEMMEIVVNAL